MSEVNIDGVAEAAIAHLKDEVRVLRERVATLERALSDSTRRELLLDKRRAALERDVRRTADG